MTASVSHVYQVDNATGANPTISVTDTPAAGNVLVLLVATSNTFSAITAVSGCGATWSRVQGALSDSSILDAWIGVGATSSGTVTTTGSAFSRSLMLFMATGTTAQAVGVTAVGAGAQTTPSQTAGDGQLVIGFSFTDTAANSVTGTTPSTGWTETTGQISTTPYYMGTVYRAPTTSASHNFTAQRSSSTTYVSQIVLGGTRTNLVKNPSFEVDTTGWTFQFNTTLTRDTTEFNKGTASLKAVSTSASIRIAVYGATGGAAANSDSIPVSVGQRVTLSAYVKVASGSVQHRATIHWFNSSGTWLSNTDGAMSAMSTSWQRLSVTGTAPTNAAKFGVCVIQETGATTTYIDGVVAEISDALGGYFDGSSTDTGKTYAWTGTANASTSTEAVSSNTISSALSGSGTLTSTRSVTRSVSLSGSGTLTSNLTDYQEIASTLSGSGTLTSSLGRFINTALSGEGSLASVLGRQINTVLSGSGALVSEITNYHQFTSDLSGSGSLVSVLSGYQRIDSELSGSGTLASALTNWQEIDSQLSGSGTLVSVLARSIHTALSGSGRLTSALSNYRRIASALGSEGVLYAEMGVVFRPVELPDQHLGKLAAFSVTTSGVPVNPAKGSGSAPSVSVTYIKGTDPEFALGEDNVLTNGAIGTYEGEIVSLTLDANSGKAAVSMDTLLGLLNTERHLFPFIDYAPGTWTAARAIEYWTQQCGVFYDKVPGECVAYASGYGHTIAYAAAQSARFYEKTTGGATSTVVLNNRSVTALGAAVTGTTAFHDDVAGTSAQLSLTKNHKALFSVGLALLGSGRTSTVTWNFVDRKKHAHAVVLTATSAGSITATVDGLTVGSTSVTAGGSYRITLSLELVSPTALVGKLGVATDDLAGTGVQIYSGNAVILATPLPGVLDLLSIVHASSGGSGSQMLRWGTYLSVDDAHPQGIPAVQKALGQTSKDFGFVSGFTGNVWGLMNEFCSLARLEVRFIERVMHVLPRDTSLSLPGVSWSQFSVTTQRREKFKQVAVKNRKSKAVTTGDAVLWKADSVYQLNVREVQEFTVQTEHSILSVANPIPVPGIEPFPYKQGTGQYVVTGADGYIIAPQWWIDNGGKIECSLTGREGEISIKITAPGIDSVRAPYRISEGAADRPALYVSGSGIVNTPEEVVVSTGASKAREGHDSVYESPFISGLSETYDAAMAMAAEYSAAAAELTFEVPNDFDTPTGLGQAPAGRLVTDNVRNYRITDVTQTNSRVSGTATAHTTIGAYVASYPAGATIADEKARHAGRTIREFNIKPLRSSSDDT